MGILLNANPDFESERFRHFLTSDLISPLSPTDEIIFEQDVPEEHKTDPTNQRYTRRGMDHGVENVQFLSIESWKVYENAVVDSQGNMLAGDLIGIHRFQVPREREVYLSTDFVLYVRNELLPSEVETLLSVLENLQPDEQNITPEELDQLVLNQIGPNLTLDDFTLTSRVRVSLHGKPWDLDANQRDALMHLCGYKDAGPVYRQQESYGTIEAGRDPRDERQITLEDWVNFKRIYWAYTKTEAFLTDGGEVSGGLEAWVDDLRNMSPTQKANIISGIVDHLIPPTCGTMKQYDTKIATLIRFPEFKVEWIPKSFKIGCARITIKIPKIFIRWTDMDFYAFYKLPTDIKDFALRIAATCVVKTALVSAVIGIILANPAAAAASFVPQFKLCLKDDITDCVHPGVAVFKQKGRWRGI